MNQQEQYDYKFKIVLIGNSAVGKTSLLDKYVNDEIYQQIIFVDYRTRIVQMNGINIKLFIWNPCGQKNFKSLIRSYLRGAFGIIFMYDVTDQNSFKDVKVWLAKVEKYIDVDPVKMLIGNKADLDCLRKVTIQEGQKFAASMNASFIETSAKDSQNIETAFMTLVNQFALKLADNQNQFLIKFEPQIALKQKKKKVNEWC